jgi:hypothetical protein
MMNNGVGSKQEDSTKNYEEKLLKEFATFSNRAIGMQKRDPNHSRISKTGNLKMKLNVIPIGERNNISKAKPMDYFQCTLTYKKKSFCGSKKITLFIEKVEREGYGMSLPQTESPGSEATFVDVLAITATGEKYIISQIEKHDWESLETDFITREAERLLRVRNHDKILRAVVLLWKSQFHQLYYTKMVEFNNVYEQFDREDNNDVDQLQLDREPEVFKYQSPFEDYSEVAIRINEDKDMVMDPAIRSHGDSTSNYRTIKLDKNKLIVDLDRDTIGKDKYKNKLESQRKTNLQNLTEFKDAKDNGKAASGAKIPPGPLTLSMAASHHAGDLSNLKKNLTCQVMAIAILGYRFKAVKLIIESIGPSKYVTKKGLDDYLLFELCPDKFSETPMTHVYRPQMICDFSKVERLRSSLIGLRMIGFTENDQELSIGTIIVLLNDLVDLFDSFNHNVVSIPFIRIPQTDGFRGVLLLTKKPAQEIERISHNMEDGLFNEIVKSPQFEIFSRNSMTQFNYNSGEMKSPILQASSPFFPAHQSKPSNNLLDPLDMGELFTNQKLRSLVWDTLQYISPEKVSRFCSKTEDYLKLAILSRPEQARVMNQSVIMNKSSLFDLAKSKILGDIRNLQQEDLKLEVFDLRLSDSFLNNWAIIERAENFHQRMWIMLSPSTQISFHRFKKAEVLKIRLQIMNQLFYNILRDYFHKPSIMAGPKLGFESFKTGFETGDNLGSTSMKNHPLFMVNLRGLCKDYYLLELFIIEKCPLLSRKISLDWQGLFLFLLPKILDLLSDLLTNHRFVSLLDKLFGGDNRLKSRSHSLVQLVCIAFQMMESKATSNCWILEDATDSFEANFQSFMHLYEEKIFQEFELQIHQNYLRNQEGNRNLLSNIFVSIQEAVTVGNTLSWLESATKSLQSNLTIQTYLKFNSVTNSLAMKLLDLSQTLRLTGKQIISMVSKPEEEINWRVFFKVATFCRGRSNSAVRERAEKCYVNDCLSMSNDAQFKLKFSLGSHKNNVEVELTKHKVFVLNELTQTGSPNLVLTIELCESDPFNLYREVLESKIGRSDIRLDLLNKDQVHILELKMNNPDDFYEEYWFQLKILVTTYSTLQDVKDESLILEFSDKSNRRDPFATEKKLLFESRDGLESMSGGNLIADELTAANFVQTGPYKMNIATVETVTNRRCFNHLSRVFRLNPSTAVGYNYFKNVHHFKERAISYLEILKNLNRLEEVESVRVDPSFQNLSDMGV